MIIYYGIHNSEEINNISQWHAFIGFFNSQVNLGHVDHDYNSSTCTSDVHLLHIVVTVLHDAAVLIMFCMCSWYTVESVCCNVILIASVI